MTTKNWCIMKKCNGFSQQIGNYYANYGNAKRFLKKLGQEKIIVRHDITKNVIDNAGEYYGKLLNNVIAFIEKQNIN